jgi:plasmid stability protein
VGSSTGGFFGFAAGRRRVVDAVVRFVLAVVRVPVVPALRRRRPATVASSVGVVVPRTLDRRRWPARSSQARPTHVRRMHSHVLHMYGDPVPKMVQIRNVPDGVHEALRARAVEAGLSLSEYLLRELRQLAERPPRAEVLARAAHRGGRLTFEDAVSAVHASREDAGR